MAILCDVRGGVAERSEHLAKCGVFPARCQDMRSKVVYLGSPSKYLLLVGRRQRAVFKERQAMEASEFYKCAN